MKNWCCIMLLVTLLVSYGTAQPKRAITHDDLFNVKRVSDPQVSPDGKWVAYVVTVFNKKANNSNSDIWLISMNGGEPRQLTTHPKADLNPRWSPDGKNLAFISTRDGSPQIYLLPIDGGESRKISQISTGASDVAWAPNGQYLVFTSRVFPDLEGDDANRKRTEEQEKNPVKAKIIDRLLFRHWNSWTNDTRSHVFIIPVSGGPARDVTPGDYDTPPLALSGSPDYVFSPDSCELAYVKNTDPMVAISTNNDLFILDIPMGEHRRLTTNPANDHSPRYSSDGRYIAYLAMQRAGFEADRQTLMLYDRQKKQHVTITENGDRSVNYFVWAPDNKTLYFTSEDQGYISICNVDIESKQVRQLTQKMFTQALTVTPDGKNLVFLAQAVNKPSEIFKSDCQGQNVVQLTYTNAELLAQLDMNPAEEFWFQGAADTKVHGFLLKPPQFNPTRKYPVIFLVHGGPQSMWYDMFHFRWNAQMFAAPGYVTVMVNPRGSTGYGQKFTDEISRDWGGKAFEDLMKGLDYVLATYDFVDPNRIAAAGGSYGGYMMNWFEAHTDRFKCLVSHDGLFDIRSKYFSTEELWFPEWDFGGVPWDKNASELYEKWSPSHYVQNFKTPMLVIHSEYDYRVPITQGIQMFTALQRRGVPSRFLYFPDEDHFVSKPLNSALWYKTVHEWIATWVNK